MPQNIIDTVFPVTQGFDSVPKEVRPPASPGAGTNEFFPVTEGQTLAPGIGVPAEVRASCIVTRP
jgi:hypothetical protein